MFVTTLSILAFAGLGDAALSRVPQAVVLRIQGAVQVSAGSAQKPARKGQFLRPGASLSLPEHSAVLLLYRNGRYSRVNGPARIDIQAVPVKPTRTTRYLAGTFNKLYAARTKRTVTVGGVRKRETLQVLSPLPYGVTPTRFRLVVSHVVPKELRRSATMADEIRIVAAGAKLGLFDFAFEPTKSTMFRRTVDLAKAAAPAAKRSEEAPISGRGHPVESKYTLHIRFIQYEDDEPELLHSRRHSFHIASAQQQQQLQTRLKAIEADRTTPGSVRQLARIAVYRELQFYGEAMVECSRMMKRDVGNPIWYELTKSLRKSD